MTDILELAARLLAIEAGRAQPIASHRQIAIQPDALVLCPVAMAGEDTTIHAIAVGRVGQPAKIQAVADPRIRDDQFRLFEWLCRGFEPYYQRCRDAEGYPQLWVSSGAAAAHLDLLADRFRFNRENPRVKRLGELLAYATERAPIAGQQALQTATGALRRHWVTGQQPAEDEHLATLLAWIEPPSDRPLREVIAEVERFPMGAKTDPEFDDEILEPLVQAYNTARRGGASREELAAYEQRIQAALASVVLRIYDATQRAIALLQTLDRPPLPDLPELELREAQEFASFMASRDDGYNVPLRDTPKAGAFKLMEREDCEQLAEAALLLGDRVARARGRLAGRVVAGTVENPRATREGPGQFTYTFELVSAQSVLHLRERDQLYLATDARLKVVVTGVRRQGSTTRIWLQVTNGQLAVGLPSVGASIELVPGTPDWDNLRRTRVRMSRRLATMPWTHTDGPVPTYPSRPAPADPLAAVEAIP